MLKQGKNSYMVRAYAKGKYSRSGCTKMDKSLLRAIAKCERYFGTWMEISSFRITRPDGTAFNIRREELNLLRGN